ncbi:hypothetical protein QI155_10555 [Thermodesulfovibrio sp. 1176]|uniref:hypothetical protein n=1 Tax=Thermodesulfovibrio sp. 1176 TaxID=3043424 RepID=UPI0024831713|nr:hypothetical protein [Thermodesulfovibrio sp. 1176]MDI1472972.1 hypothetical protein [Thermodesulfovibrio sp. 1176]
MNLLCGFYYEKGLAFIIKVTDEEYNSLPDEIKPTTHIDKENDKQVLLDFNFIKLPLTLFSEEKLPEEFELIFLAYREWEFYCSKIISSKLTKEMIIEARGMQKALENF